MITCLAISITGTKLFQVPECIQWQCVLSAKAGDVIEPSEFNIGNSVRQI